MTDQKLPPSTPFQSTPTKEPPQIPIAVKITAKIGIETMPAQKRGEITRRNGSTAIISRLDNCSVAFINPISAVNAEPARPANNNAVTTGPNSRNKDNATNCPKLVSAAKSTNTTYPCKPSTIPINKPDSMIINKDCTPNTCNCFTNNGKCFLNCGLPINAPNSIKPARPIARTERMARRPKAEMKSTIIRITPPHNFSPDNGNAQVRLLHR